MVGSGKVRVGFVLPSYILTPSLHLLLTVPSPGNGRDTRRVLARCRRRQGAGESGCGCIFPAWPDEDASNDGYCRGGNTGLILTPRRQGAKFEPEVCRSEPIGSFLAA